MPDRRIHVLALREFHLDLDALCAATVVVDHRIAPDLAVRHEHDVAVAASKSDPHYEVTSEKKRQTRGASR
ncbi:hypothetical protein HDG33_000299 [Paraburkholderia sp. Cpub6]|nr:hypothetical protein [Paraburkholderia sp. Cpub6]